MIEGDDEAAQQRIAELQKKLATTNDFAALASEYSDDFGSRDNGGNLGVSSGDGFPAEFETALLELSEGQISAPIKIDNATHFIKLIALSEKTAPSYDEQKTVIAAELSRARAEEQFIQDVQAIEELAYNAENLQEVAEQLGLPLGKTALFSRVEAKEAILQDSRVVTAAFSEQVVQEGHSSELIELSTDSVVVLKLIEHKPVRILSLEEKKAAILADLQLKKAKDTIAQQAASIRTLIDNGTDIATISEQQDIKLSSQLAAQRNAADVPAELLTSVFEMAQPEEGAVTIAERHLDNGDYVIVSLSKIIDGSVDDLSEAERTSLRGNLSSSIAGDEYRAWQEQLRTQADINVYSSVSPTY
jgi:peptidyl-prolyl cis-trans isomerase D